MEFVSYTGIAGSIQEDMEILMLHSSATSTDSVEVLDLYRFLQDISLVLAIEIKRKTGKEVRETLDEIYVQNHRFYVVFFQQATKISKEEAQALLEMFIIPKIE